MTTLIESNEAIKDRRDFMKAQILNWLIGATDGHAKNYSLFLEGSAIKLTPFYDVMSALPAAAQAHPHYESLKLAMRVAPGHYEIHTIAKRHFL